MSRHFREDLTYLNQRSHKLHPIHRMPSQQRSPGAEQICHQSEPLNSQNYPSDKNKLVINPQKLPSAALLSSLLFTDCCQKKQGMFQQIIWSYPNFLYPLLRWTYRGIVSVHSDLHMTINVLLSCLKLLITSRKCNETLHTRASTLVRVMHSFSSPQLQGQRLFKAFAAVFLWNTCL